MSRVFRRRGWSRRRVLFVVMGTGAFLLAVAGISTARWWVVISWVGHVSMTGWLAGLGVLLAAGAGGALACRKRTVRPETGGGSDVWWMSAVMIVVPVLALTGMSLVVLLAVLDTGQSVVRVEVIKTALGVGAGAGAIVALVLAGRRQWTAERVAADAKLDAAERRVTELYTKAVEQLGSDKAAVRLGGLYALERLAQDRSQRQVVVNVICAYLRMPFTPSLEFDALGREDGQPKNSQPNSDRLATVVDDCISEDVQGDREELEVRLAAQDILFTHLCPNGPGYWGDTRLNLTGSVLVNFDLRACHVADVKFDRARFLGFASFEGTVFHGIANFVDAEFPYFTNFTSVEFQRGAWFSDAVFHGIPGAGEAAVHDARFSTKAAFEGATFCRAMFRDPALFRSVVFDGDARFDDATFYRGCTFSASTFRGAARFNRTKFIALAQFGNEDFEVNTYPAATFGHIVQFNGATFQVEARFEGARVLNPNSNLHAWPPGWRVDSTSSGATLQSESIATNVIIEGPDQPA